MWGKVSGCDEGLEGGGVICLPIQIDEGDWFFDMAFLSGCDSIQESLTTALECCKRGRVPDIMMITEDAGRRCSSAVLYMMRRQMV